MALLSHSIRRFLCYSKMLEKQMIYGPSGKSLGSIVLQSYQSSVKTSCHQRCFCLNSLNHCDAGKDSSIGKHGVDDTGKPSVKDSSKTYRRPLNRESEDPLQRTVGILSDDIREYFIGKRRQMKQIFRQTTDDQGNRIENDYNEPNSLSQSTWPSTCDVLVIGGGAMGSSIAYHLKERAMKGLSVVVVEQDDSYRKASTVLSVGGIRQQFSIPENILLSMYGMQFLRKAPELLAVEGAEVPDMQFNPGGYLTLASEAGVENLKDNFDIQRDVGAKVEFLSAKSLKQRFPWLNTEGIEAGVMGFENEGWFDPWSLLCCLRRKAVSLGAEYINGKVTGMSSHRLDDIVTEGIADLAVSSVKEVEVTLPDGEVRAIRPAIVVLAAGAWSGEIGRMVGIGNGLGIMRNSIPIEPRKRYVYCIHAPEGPGLDCPLVIDPSHTYFRREGLGGMYLCGQSPREDEEPPIDNLDVDETFFYDQVWPTIAKRAPAFENAKLQASWAGYYDYNTFDQNGIIGIHPLVSNMFITAGFSGHGIQQAPAVGRALMECILYGEFRSINLERFAFERILLEEPLSERYIV